MRSMRRYLAYVLRNSLRQQAIIVFSTLALLPFYWATLEIPKTIINQALAAAGTEDIVPLVLAGREIVRLPAIRILAILCLAMLLAALAHAGIKLFVNVYKGVVAERMMLRMRHDLLLQAIGSDEHDAPTIGHGELVNIIATETEPVGGFFGDAIALPMLQGGLFLTAMLFIFAQAPLLGFGALALFPLQIWLVPRLIARRQTLEVARVLKLRGLAETIARAASARDARLRQSASSEVASFDDQLRGIFDNRIAIYRTKFATYFLLAVSAQLTPFLFLLAGGWLVLEGSLSLGALVTAIAAYRDLVSPWDELIYWTQDLRTVAAKFEQLKARFQPASQAGEAG